MSVLLSTAYFPPVEWLAHWVQSGRCILEAHEHFQKQSFRSRAQIVGPNGAQTLSVPVSRNAKDIREVEVSNVEPWQRIHLKALESAYSNAPFFDVLFPDVEALLRSTPSTLWELNLKSMGLFQDWLELEGEIEQSTEFTVVPASDEGSEAQNAAMTDCRALHPKRPTRTQYPDYQQVFQHKIGFHHNLSALDLFFNLGRSSWDYLNDLQLEPPTNRN